MSSANILSSPPFLPIEGVINFRTIGGYKTSNGRPVHLNLVFRSGEVSGITEAGKQQLVDLGIRRVFDTRTDWEIKNYKTLSPDVSGVEFVRVPIGKENAWDPAGLEKHLKQYQENELQAFVQDAQKTLEIGASALETIFRHLLERPNEPCLFHCTGNSISAGKDRTGLIAALILMLVGVDDNDILKDYALTTAGLEPVREKLALRFQSMPVFQKHWQGAVNMGSSKEESMTAILSMIREKHGGAAGYLTAFTTLKDDDLEIIRNNLTTAV
ncbi:protein tyrosine serine phosphatase [Favolaschia claudopus]|uniref:Protein tyrosine serine phosphatase n=1 Tax=Favolaschia claudopus TaxID=2862362 RepID=A0AAW0E1W6_9AGAR